MQVHELIAQLQTVNPFLQVHIEQPSHDHWRTMLAPVVTSVEETSVIHSDYHNEWSIAKEQDGGETVQVLVLGS